MKVDYIQHCGSDLTVVNAARVSFDKESALHIDLVEDPDPDAPYLGSVRHKVCVTSLKDKDKKLVQYLARNQHTSPFNHSFLTVRVKAPIFVARQLVKHKFMPWNEISRRYVDSEPEFYEPDVWRFKADNVKQGSRSSGLTQQEVNTEFNSREEQWGYMNTPHELHNDAIVTYKHMLSMGVCPEQGSYGSYLSRCILSGTGVRYVRAFCDMLNLRLKEDTQKETREVVTMISEIVKTHWPVSYEALVGDK
jgi:thymidylate synthase (FAD)